MTVINRSLSCSLSGELNNDNALTAGKQHLYTLSCALCMRALLSAGYRNVSGVDHFELPDTS